MTQIIALLSAAGAMGGLLTALTNLFSAGA